MYFHQKLNKTIKKRICSFSVCFSKGGIENPWLVSMCVLYMFPQIISVLCRVSKYFWKLRLGVHSFVMPIKIFIINGDIATFLSKFSLSSNFSMCWKELLSGVVGSGLVWCKVIYTKLRLKGKLMLCWGFNKNLIFFELYSYHAITV